MIRHTQVVTALEALYARGEAPAWARGVVAPMRALLPFGEQLAFVGFGLQPARMLFMEFSDEATAAPFRRALEGAIGATNEQNFAQLYRPAHPVWMLSALDRTMQRRLQAASPEPAADAFGLITEPEPLVGVAVSVVVHGLPSIPARDHAALSRLVMHVDAATRLRLRPDAVVGYVTPEGRVELGPPAGDLRVEALGAAAQGIDRARTREHRGDGEGALSVWPALVSGRLSLAERVDTDGKRVYDLYENAPKHRAMRALTEREGTVLHECARGLSNKEVSYALGISQAAVSQALASAATKLGAGGVRSLVRLASGLRGAGGSVASIESLSPAERAVAELVVRGMTNAQIARARGSAERTVANQVAAILRKTGAATRRGLITRAP